MRGRQNKECGIAGMLYQSKSKARPCKKGPVSYSENSPRQKRKVNQRNIKKSAKEKSKKKGKEFSGWTESTWRAKDFKDYFMQIEWASTQGGRGGGAQQPLILFALKTGGGERCLGARQNCESHSLGKRHLRTETILTKRELWKTTRGEGTRDGGSWEGIVPKAKKRGESHFRGTGMPVERRQRRTQPTFSQHMVGGQ